MLYKNSQAIILYLICYCLFLDMPKVAGSTQFKPSKHDFYYNTDLMVGSLLLPLVETRHTLTIPDYVLRKRVERSKDDETIEPLLLNTPTSTAGINAIAEKIARPGREVKLLKYIQVEVKNSNSANSTQKMAQIPISPKVFNLIDPSQYGDLFSKVHSSLVLDGAKIKSEPILRSQLFKQLEHFLDKEELYKLKDEIKKGDQIPIDQFLLPEFAKKMVRKFILHRGPNCFHAALSFQNIKLPTYPMVNVKEEKGYHRVMINYDELWAILNRSFYEIDLETESLKYGDMIVLFEVPAHFTVTDPNAVIDYRWIRHTTTYLFNGYTFSKGSKSPNTPYAVRTLADEWETWSKYSKKLGAKIFRKTGVADQDKVPFDLQDWIL